MTDVECQSLKLIVLAHSDSGASYADECIVIVSRPADRRLSAQSPFLHKADCMLYAYIWIRMS